MMILMTNLIGMVIRVLEFSREELELVSKELNHFVVIPGLFRQIRGHSMYT